MRVCSVPALLCGILVAVYWMRVGRMAIKTRRKTGNAANLLPPELLGRLLRIIWFPTVGAWITLPFVVATRQQLQLPIFLRPLFVDRVINYAAAILVGACLAASWVCWRRMGKSWRMGINPNEKTTLIVSGPYAYVRHPIYALSTLMMLATIVAVPSPAMLAVGLVHSLLLQWEARREEQYLLSVHGDTYGRYRSAVGRFIPRRFKPFVMGNA